jgi:DNA-binding MarR family transcriptional regulator
MHVLEKQLTTFLQRFFGSRPSLGEATALSAKLPLFLRSRYSLFKIQLFGQECLVAIETQESNDAAPAGYSSAAKVLKATLGQNVILVVHRLTSYARDRLARQGVSFIVPGTQMFIPFLVADLRERFRRPRAAEGKHLTPAAQLLILFHLQREPLDHVPLQEIAQRLGCSAMTITNVKEELESAKICKTSRRGRAVTLLFPEFKRALWNSAEPLLSSPVKKERWVDWHHPAYPAIAAGLTALSRSSMIEDERWPTFALFHATFQANLKREVYRSVPDPEENSVRLQAWTYNRFT